MRSIVLAALLALLGSAAHAVPTPVDFATVSMSAPGVPRTVTDTVCASDGNDLVCDRGVYITSSSRVGIGTAAPRSTLHVSGSARVWGSGEIGYAPFLVGAQNSNKYLYMQMVSASSVGLLGTYDADSPGAVMPFVINTRVLISTDGWAVTPSSTLQVSGSLRLAHETSASLAVCDANRTGAIRYTGGDFSFCRNGSVWETLTSLGGGGGLGDRIVSGTTNATVNSATTYISLTTVSTTWGYLSSGTSYLPRFHAAQVSATTISTTAMQMFSPTIALACSADLAGTIRYNSPTTTLELCTGSGWQPMGVGIPAGTISAFASTTCPTGWSEYTAARGRFLRGIDNGAGNDPSGTRAPGSTQADLLASHSHASSLPTLSYPSLGNPDAAGYTTVSSIGAFSQPTSSAGGAETRPRNVAVTYCQFNGTSNGWNNPLSGGSTTAAGSTGQLQYNTGNAFDASAGLTWANASSLLTVSGRISATNISVTALTVNGVAITGGGGVTRLASLTDVTTTGAVSGSVLTFNAATSSWTALPLQNVMSTTTMASGLPDAIYCSGPAGAIILYLSVRAGGLNAYQYNTNEDHNVVFDDNGSFASAITTFNYNNTCRGKSISQLYADGQAFNFIGTANDSGSMALGDRITSGTASGVVAMAGGTVSFTTGGTSGTAYLDTLGRFIGPGVSTTGAISATSI